MDKRKNRIVIVISAAAAFAAAIAIAVVFLRAIYVAPVIMYHAIDHEDKITKLSVAPESFARQMEFLKRYNYNVIKLEKMVPYIEKRQKAPPRTLAITFDDGFRNNYEYAYPVLKKYDIPATIFIIVDKIGEPGYVGWKELKEMSDSGVVSIGSHSKSHAWLPSLRDEALKAEVALSKNILEDKLGKKVSAFCYPIGAFDDRVKKAVKDAGYALAVATNPGRLKGADDIYAIKRIKISRTSDSLFTFWIETSGLYTWIKEHRDD